MIRFALPFAAFCLLVSTAVADHIFVSGAVTGLWSADTVFVTGEIRVPPGDSLTISPGVKVLFMGSYQLIVHRDAVLRAVGVPTDSILFDVLTTTSLHWRGISFKNSSDSSRLEYCRLTNGLAPGSGFNSHGGALTCDHCSPTIRHCLIENCKAYEDGGALYLWYASPIITDNIFQGNRSMHGSGGAIWMLYSNSIIENNTFLRNYARYGGGAIECASQCNPTIHSNILLQDTAYWAAGGGITAGSNFGGTISNNVIQENYSAYGGGIFCGGCSPRLMIIHNIITNNVCDPASNYHGGGGIEILNCDLPINIIENIINHNSTGYSYGGGINCWASDGTATIRGNIISANTGGYGAGMMVRDAAAALYDNQFIANLGRGVSTSAAGLVMERNLITQCDDGVGIFLYNYTFAQLNHNTLTYNTRQQYTGGISSSLGAQAIIANCIVWRNGNIQISRSINSPMEITYTDVLHGWPGLGNLNMDPLFVDSSFSDFRLQWNSPCIDAGDPDSLDPDGTRADMGAYYFDRSRPVRVLLSPHQIPYLLPVNGGNIVYTLRAENIDSLTHVALIWCDLTMPDSSISEPIQGPDWVTLAPGMILNAVHTQNIPAMAAFGVYHFNAYAVVGADTSKDSFIWGKLGSVPGQSGDWSNTGDSFPGVATLSPEAIHPSSFTLHACHPNPFNPTTAISYELRSASHVSLKIYDTTGRLVTTLVNGWRLAGTHEVTFNGSGLASGIYLAEFQAGEFTAVQKLVLLK